MGVGVASVTVLLSSLLAASTAESSALVWGRRVPIALVTITSAGGQGQTRSSALISSLSGIFRDHTDLEVMPIEEAIPRSCEGALGCMTRRIRTDYDRAAYELPGGEVLPFARHAERVARDRNLPRMLLVVSSFVKPGAPDRVFAMLVDLELALEIHHRADRRDPDWRESSDARIDEAAVLHRTERVELAGEAETRRFFERLLTEELRGVLEERGHWHPYGRLELRNTAAGGTVRIDGEVVGLSLEGTTPVLELGAGARTVELETADGRARRYEVLIRAGQTEVLSVEREVAGSARSALRPIVLYGGLGLAATGLVVTTLAAAFASGAVDRVCFEGGACEHRAAFAGVGTDSTGGLVEPSQSGPLLAPLGYSLMLSGGVLGLGTLLLTREDETPWLPLLAGVAAGGLAYGLSAALGGTP